MRRFAPSPITAVIDDAPFCNLAESCGRDLSIAEVLTPDDLAALGDLPLGYSTSIGNATLRQQIAGRHGVSAEQVLITSGAASALFLLGLMFGDGEIVVGLPCYPPALDALRGVGADVRTIQARFDHRYRVDLDELRRQLSPQTSMVMFASPQNPSAIRIPAQDISAILDLMAHACPQAYLLIDETFREATYGLTRPDDSLAGMSPRLLTCASLSKAFGVPGLRIGWLTAPEPSLYEQFRLAKFNAAISCGTVDEFLAQRVLSRADEVLAERGQTLAAARAVVETWVAANTGRLRWQRPEAGAFCCVEIDPTLGASAIEKFHADLRRAGTAIAPGRWFGDDEHIIRIGLAYETLDKFQQGLDAISGAIAGDVDQAT